MPKSYLRKVKQSRRVRLNEYQAGVIVRNFHDFYQQIELVNRRAKSKYTLRMEGALFPSRKTYAVWKLQRHVLPTETESFNRNELKKIKRPSKGMRTAVQKGSIRKSNRESRSLLLVSGGPSSTPTPRRPIEETQPNPNPFLLYPFRSFHII